MKFRNWSLPVIAGALGGWLAAGMHNGEVRSPLAGQRVRQTTAGPGMAVVQQSPVREGHSVAAATEVADRGFARAEELIARIITAGPEELKKIYQSGEVAPRTFSGMLARSALWQRWVETDPAGGLNWLIGKGDGGERELLSTWMQTNQGAAIAWAETHPPVSFWFDLKFSGSATEIKDILLVSLSHSKVLQGISGYSLPLALLHQLDPPAAQEVYGAAAQVECRSVLARELSQGMGVHDPGGAIAWLRAQKAAGTLSPKEYSDAASDVLKSIAWRAPEKVSAELEDTALTESQRRELRDVVVKGFAREGPDALRGFLAALPDGSVSKSNYVDIRDIRAGNLPVTEMHSLMQELLRTGVTVEGSNFWDWTGRDPAQELVAAAALPDDAGRAKLIESLHQAMVVSGSLPRAEEVAKLPEAVRAATALSLAEAASALGNEELARQLTDCAPVSALVEKLKTIPENYVVESGASLADLYRRLTPADRTDCTAAVAERMARTGPEDAIACVQTLPAEEWPRAWSGIAGAMATVDEGEAAAWVSALPDDGTRDEAVSRLTKHLVSSDPEAAVQWALAIRDPERRRATLEDTASAWSKLNRDAAEQMPGMANMAPEDRAAVESALQRKEVQK